jgi:hypothetical protein
MIDTVSCISVGDSKDLFECLDSYAKNASFYGRKPRMIAIDQSPDSTRRNEMRESVSRINREHRLEASLISDREIQIYIDRSMKYSWVDHELLKYALLGDDSISPVYGAALNVAMIAAEGHRSLVTNSTTRCVLIGSPGGSDDLLIQGDNPNGKFANIFNEFESFAFYKDIKEIEKTSPVDCDANIFGLTEDLLKTSDIVSAGTWGDSGLRGRELYVVTGIHNDYEKSISAGAVHRFAPSRVVGGVSLRAQLIGIKSMAIPFFPLESIYGGLAGQSVTGVLARNISSLGAVGVLPISVKKVQSAQAFAQFNVDRIIDRLSIIDKMSICIGALPIGSVRQIGYELQKLTDNPSLLEMVTGTWTTCISDAAKSKLDFVISKEQSDDLTRLIEIAGSWRDRNQIDDSFTDQTRGFSALLSGWDGLVAAISDLSDTGVKLG